MGFLEYKPRRIPTAIVVNLVDSCHRSNEGFFGPGEPIPAESAIHPAASTGSARQERSARAMDQRTRR